MEGCFMFQWEGGGSFLSGWGAPHVGELVVMGGVFEKNRRMEGSPPSPPSPTMRNPDEGDLIFLGGTKNPVKHHVFSMTKSPIHLIK